MPNVRRLSYRLSTMMMNDDDDDDDDDDDKYNKLFVAVIQRESLHENAEESGA